MPEHFPHRAPRCADCPPMPDLPIEPSPADEPTPAERFIHRPLVEWEWDLEEDRTRYFAVCSGCPSNFRGTDFFEREHAQAEADSHKVAHRASDGRPGEPLTRAQRRDMRRALLERGWYRTHATPDPHGRGDYTETWRHNADGLALLTVTWGPYPKDRT